MKTPLDHFRHHAMCLAVWAALASNIALANDVDDQGRVIAGPLETNLVERGYLFYPLRVLPKTQDTNSVSANVVRTADNSVEDPSLKTAPVSPKVSLPAVPLPQAAAPAPAPAPAPVAVSPSTPVPPSAHDTHDDSKDHTPAVALIAPASTVTQPAKPTAASVLVHRIEPIKATPLPAAKSHGDAGHESAEPAQPAMSEAEPAKDERANAAPDRAEKNKQEQAKAALDKEELRKLQKAKAEQLKAERAKVAQERADKLKEEQAKAELARAERVRAAALAKVDRALEELARADKIREALLKAEAAKSLPAASEQ